MILANIEEISTLLINSRDITVGVEILNMGMSILIAVFLISIGSHSYQTDALLSILILIPLFILHIIYIRSKYKKMGPQLIELKKTDSEANEPLVNMVLFLLTFSIIFAGSTYLFWTIY